MIKIVLRESLVLFEEQKFDLEKNKQQILRFIKEVLAGGSPNLVYNPFYRVLAAGGEVGDAEAIGLSKEHNAAWLKYFRSEPFTSNGPWSQYNINQDFARKSGLRTYNFYITLTRTAENFLKFFKNYYKLATYLKPISDQSKTSISFKTLCHLDFMVGHNDNLKVFYYDHKLEDDIRKAVALWLHDSDIEVSPRAYEHGVDIKGSADGNQQPGSPAGEGSYGQLLSQKISEALIELIKQNGVKYTPEQYFDWVKTHLLTLIKQHPAARS